MANDLSLTPFKALAGVDVFWGKWGRPGWRKLEPAFFAELELTLAELWEECPWGEPDAILSGGAYVPREIKPGDRHAAAQAFDLSGLDWSSGSGPRLRVSRRAKEDLPELMLGIECILRRGCPQVLGPWYNAAHEDHWHIDSRAEARGWQPKSRSDVTFARACLHHIHGVEPGRVDAEIEVMGAEWDEWLLATAREAFAR